MSLQGNFIIVSIALLLKYKKVQLKVSKKANKCFRITLFKIAIVIQIFYTSKEKLQQNMEKKSQGVQENEIQYTNLIDINMKDYEIDHINLIKNKQTEVKVPEFHCDVYLRSKTDNSIKIVKMPYQKDDIQRQVYEKTMNNTNSTLIQKLYHNPDLTEEDRQFVVQQKQYAIRHSAMAGGISFFILGSLNIFGKLGKSKFRHPGIAIAPIGCMLFTYKVEQYRIIQKLHNMNLDTKYNIPKQ